MENPLLKILSLTTYENEITIYLEVLFFFFFNFLNVHFIFFFFFFFNFILFLKIT